MIATTSVTYVGRVRTFPDSGRRGYTEMLGNLGYGQLRLTRGNLIFGAVRVQFNM